MVENIVLQSNKLGAHPLTFSTSIKVGSTSANGSLPFANSQQTMPRLYISDFSLYPEKLSSLLKVLEITEQMSNLSNFVPITQD